MKIPFIADQLPYMYKKNPVQFFLSKVIKNPDWDYYSTEEMSKVILSLCLNLPLPPIASSYVFVDIHNGAGKETKLLPEPLNEVILASFYKFFNGDFRISFDKDLVDSLPFFRKEIEDLQGKRFEDIEVFLQRRICDYEILWLNFPETVSRENIKNFLKLISC